MLLRVREPNSPTLKFLAFVSAWCLEVMEMDCERRRGPRYLFVADTEVTDLASDAKRSARTSELSISGASLTRGTLHRKAPSFGSKSFKEMSHSLRSVVSYVPFPIRE